MHKRVKTIILSSLSGGDHKRLAKIYAKKNYKENITLLCLQYLEKSTIYLEKVTHYTKSKTSNYRTHFFNYLQKIRFLQLITKPSDASNQEAISDLNTRLKME